MNKSSTPSKPSTTQQTIEYIKDRPHIKHCLKNGLINYSSLARQISKDLKIEKKSSIEAILVAARRFQDKLKKELNNEKKIKTLLTRSEISIKNKISVLILSKNLDFNYLIEFQKKIKNENASFYILEGTDNYTLIIPEKYSQKLLGKFESKLIQSNHNLALINFKSPKEIEKISGVISYLTSLFATNGVNILEFLSCWKDTIFVIDKNDVNKAISFLDF